MTTNWPDRLRWLPAALIGLALAAVLIYAGLESRRPRVQPGDHLRGYSVVAVDRNGVELIADNSTNPNKRDALTWPEFRTFQRGGIPAVRETWRQQTAALTRPAP